MKATKAKPSAKKSRKKLPKVPQFRKSGIGVKFPPLGILEARIDVLREPKVVRHHSITEIEDALRRGHGIRSVAASSLGISLRGLNQRISENAELKDVIATMNEELLDRSECKLFERIDAGDPRAIRFHLKCKGRKRGWAERRDINAALSEESEIVRPPNVIVNYVTKMNPNAPKDSGIPEPPRKTTPEI